MFDVLRSKRFWKRLAIGFCLLGAVLLIVNAILAWQAERRLQAKIDALRAAGEPASIADLAPQPVADEENSAIILERIAADLDAFDKEYRAYYSEAGDAIYKREERGDPPTESELAVMRSMLDKFPEILPALNEASAREKYASRLDFTLPASQFMESQLKRTNRIRALTRYVDWKMTTLIAENKPSEAVRLGIQVLRLARLYDREPLLLHYLVSIAVRGVIVDSINRALRAGPIEPEVRQELDAELGLQDSRESLRRAFREERAFAIDYTKEITGRLFAQMRWPMAGWFWSELRPLDQAIESADKPWHEVQHQWDLISEKERSAIRIAGLDEWSPMGESLRAVFRSDSARLTLNRCLRILNALGAYRDRTGADAESLEQLSLPPEAVVDPWSGRPLHIKMADQGWVVYSVWWNGNDDGGRMGYGDGDWGLVPPGYPAEP